MAESKCPGGGKTISDLVVNSMLGEIGFKLKGSLRFSTVSGLVLITFSTSHRKVLKDSSLKLEPWDKSIPSNMSLAERI